MTRGIGGTGLGLYICRELVRRLDGRIWVEGNEAGSEATGRQGLDLLRRDPGRRTPRPRNASGQDRRLAPAARHKGSNLVRLTPNQVQISRAGEGTRTPGLLITSDVLYQLSYSGAPTS